MRPFTFQRSKRHSTHNSIPSAPSFLWSTGDYRSLHQSLPCRPICSISPSTSRSSSGMSLEFSFYWSPAGGSRHSAFLLPMLDGPQSPCSPRSLTVPIAGTALVIADPYLTARSLSTPTTIFAIDSFMRGQRTGTFLWIVLTVLVHPQMAAFAVGFLVFLYWTNHESPAATLKHSFSASTAGALPSRWPQGFNFNPAQGTYREVLYSRTFFFAALWHWYEWIGVVLPLSILYAFTRIHPRATLPAFQRICRALVPFGIFDARISPVELNSLSNEFRALAADAILPPDLRSLLSACGRRLWRIRFERSCLALVGTLRIAGYRYVCRKPSEFCQQSCIIWPVGGSKNPWVSAFRWIRNNTPRDAGSRYPHVPFHCRRRPTWVPRDCGA